ncbi:MAG TPA: hypothetical protein VKY92_06810 [Verrucomicrobiae bacterium]|nr:hypothetical protein [Verrucomicrobiae bacterium]
MIKLAGLAAAGTAIALRSPAKDALEEAAPRPFDYRLLLGWINDNCPRPLMGKRWPIIDVNDATVADYRSFFRIAKETGYNGITLWGLYVSHAWPVPLKNALIPERRRIIDRILKEADRHKIKVLFGLGVYSWGFEEIIKHDPTTGRNEGRMAWGSFTPDNGVAMCYHSASARQWMRDIVDLCVNEVGTQGFGFQSGDLGRCYCSECKRLSDVEFHSRVIDETAAYIKQRHPDQILGMSAWGVDLGGGADGLKRMTSHLDFLTDVTDQSARKGRDYRRSLTAHLPCALGSLGGAVIVPPQRWERDRWFLPHAQMTARSIKSLHEDGGRAFEFFMGPLNNPQYNLMTRFVGLLLQRPDLSCEQALSRVVDHMFSPKSKTTSEGIIEWLLEVEKAYMGRVGDISSGEFDFEPLKGETAGEPIYLTRLSSDALAGYEADLSRLFKELPGLAAGCRRSRELSLITRCVDNVLRDVQQVRAQRKP